VVKTLWILLPGHRIPVAVLCPVEVWFRLAMLPHGLAAVPHSPSIFSSHLLCLTSAILCLTPNALSHGSYLCFLLLFPANNTLVNNAALVSNAAPLYAPPGLHLLSATVLGDPKLSVEALIAAVRTELGAQFPESDSRTWHPLRVYRIRIAQFAQPSGIWERLPAERTDVPGLVLAGEYTVSSSLQGAFLSGQRAAQAVMKA